MTRKGANGCSDTDDHGTEHTCPVGLATLADPPTDYQHKETEYCHKILHSYRASFTLHSLALRSGRKAWRRSYMPVYVLILVKSLLVVFSELWDTLQSY